MERGPGPGPHSPHCVGGGHAGTPAFRGARGGLSAGIRGPEPPRERPAGWASGPSVRGACRAVLCHYPAMDGVGEAWRLAWSTRVVSRGPTPGINPWRGQDPATPLPLTWLLWPACITWIFLRTTWQGLGIKDGVSGGSYSSLPASTHSLGGTAWSHAGPKHRQLRSCTSGGASRRQRREAAAGTRGGQSGEGAQGSHSPQESVLGTEAEIMSFTLAAEPLSAHCDWDA